MNLADCAALPRTPENGTWYRLIDLRFITTALGSAHTRATRSRFNPGPLLGPSDRFATLYFADTPLTAQFEYGAMLGSALPGGSAPHPGRSSATLNVAIVLREVIDLTDVTLAQIPLGTTVQELTGDWSGYGQRSALTAVTEPVGIAPTQVLGQALFKTGAEGFRTISARVPWQRTLTVFIDNLRPGSTLTFTDPGHGVVHRIPAPAGP